MLDIQGLAIRSLAPGQLHRACEPAQFDFTDTSTLPPPAEPYGQQRAMAALRLGLQTPGRGYNMFVLGSPGTGRQVGDRSGSRAVPDEQPSVSHSCLVQAKYRCVSFHTAVFFSKESSCCPFLN